MDVIDITDLLAPVDLTAGVTHPPVPCLTIPFALLAPSPLRLCPQAPRAMRVQAQPVRRMAGGHASPRHQDSVSPPTPNAM